jgi:hypothetical protein
MVSSSTRIAASASGIAQRTERGERLRLDLGIQLGEQREEQLLQTLERFVEVAFGEFRAGADLAHRDAVEAVRAEGFQCGFQQFLAALPLALVVGQAAEGATRSVHLRRSLPGRCLAALSGRFSGSHGGILT